MEPRRSKHFLAHIPTIALLVLFAMSPWLGVLFFILRAIDRDAEKKEQENAEYSSDFRPQDTGAGQPARDTEPVYGHDVPTAEQQNAKKWHKTLTSLCTVFGGIFLVVGLAGLADIIDLWGYWFDWGEFLTALAQTIGGGAALAMGLRMKQARKLERQLDKIVGTRDNIPLDELFAAAGIDADRGRAAVERAEREGGATVFGYHVDDPERFGVVEFDEEFNAVSIEEKPEHPKSNYAVTGLYFYDSRVCELAKQVKPSARGELEITTLNQMYLEDGSLNVVTLGRGYAWLDTGTMESLFEASEFVRAVERSQGLSVSVVEEIAYQNGWIDRDRLLAAADKYGKSVYGQHLKKVTEGRIVPHKEAM